jgi:hypothetical protein
VAGDVTLIPRSTDSDIGGLFSLFFGLNLDRVDKWIVLDGDEF